MPHGKIIGVDYGTKRIGLAIADLETRISFPLDIVNGRNDVTRDARNVVDVGLRNDAAEYVVGLPLNMDGTDGPQSLLTRRFAFELARLSTKFVHLQDERLTSDAADDVLNEAGVPPARRQALRDLVAAQKILQAYLDRPRD